MPLKKIAKADVPEGAGLPQGAVLRFVLTGGARPLTEELVVYADGHGSATHGLKRHAEDRQVEPETVRRLIGDLALAGFFDMPPEVGQQVPDGYAYEITARSGEGSRTVVVYDGSVPPSLSPALKELRRLTRGS